MTINFIGCGRLGKTLAKLFHARQPGCLGGIVNANLQSAKNAVEFIGGGEPCSSVSELPLADLYLITARDELIATLCDKLINQANLPADAVIAHCSGALTSELLQAAAVRGYAVASIHPIKSFADPQLAIIDFAGTYCSLEGMPAAISVLKNLFVTIGATVFSINKADKIRAHAAMVIANNYLTTLHYHACTNLEAAGINHDSAKQIVSMLMADTLNNLRDLPHQTVLTGPIQRGDLATIQKHLACLQDDVIATQLYAALGIATVPLTAHDDNIKQAFIDVMTFG